LGVAGFKLRLHDIDDSRLSEIRARGGVDVEGEKGGFAPVERATTDLEPAIDGADVIIVVTGGNSQAVVALSLAPLLRDRQVILLIQGNTGGSLLVRRALDDAGCRAEIDVAEMDNYPYSCWRLSPTRIRPIVRKRWLQIATFPGNRIGEVFSRLSPLFPEAVAAPNILYTGFTNANAMLHVANCVANAGRIESGGSYKFYAEGVTPAVAIPTRNDGFGASRAVPNPESERQLWVRLPGLRRTAPQREGCAASGPSRPRSGMGRLHPKPKQSLGRPEDFR
jgi:opine dehydrogenase